jgi:calcium-dependent protein kinase
MSKGSSEAEMSSSLPPDITSSDNSSASHNSSSAAAPNLIGNITRKVDRDPYEVYEHAKVLGSGSMGSVHMVKKRDSNVGGTARWHNLSMRKQLELKGVHPSLVLACSLPVVGNFVRSCIQIDDDEEGGGGEIKDGVIVGQFGKKIDSLNVSRRKISSRHFTLDDSLHPNDPTHIRINTYLEKERKRGKYEAYYAMKSIHLTQVNDILFVNELKNEIEIMQKLDHAHITRLVETYEDRGHLYLIMELCSGGDLYSRDPYTEDQAARVVGSILSAVDFMHKHGIIHRDLKYENILFATPSPTAEIKIIDFGLSKIYQPSQRMKDGVGTVYTMAPEVLQGDYNNKADVWAIGVLTYMLLSSQMPFYGRRRKEILDKIARCNYDFKGRRWNTISRPAKSFVENLLLHDPEARPSAKEAKRSMWLNMRLASSVRTATEADMDAAACSLENYSAHKTLQKLALMVIAHKSNSHEIGFLRNVFKRYDKDRDGSIDLDEFKLCLNKYNYSDRYIEKIFNAADLSGTGHLKYTEFLAATIESTDLVTEERLAEAFDRLDADDSGYISVKNLRDLLGEDVPDAYVEQVIAEADVKDEKRVTYDDFLDMWRKELEDRQMNAWRGISKQRTVSVLAEEMFSASTDDEHTLSDGEISDYEPISHRLVSIAEIEQQKKKSSMK